MKGTNTFLILIFFTAINTYAQDFWKPIGLEGIFIGGITQNNEGRLYATEWVGMGDSVFFSDNGGNNWNSYGEVNDTFFMSISSLIFLDNGDLLLSAWDEHGGIFKSTDGSQTWERKDDGIDNTGIYRLIKNNDSLYAGTIQGLYISLDNSESWVKVNNKPDNINIIDIVRAPNGVLIAIDETKIYRSTDGGVNWTVTSLGTYSFRLLTISEEKYVFLGTATKVYRSDDWGETWVLKTTGIAGLQNMVVNQTGLIICGTELQGVLLSTDRGDTWQPINSGLPNPPHFVNSVFFDRDGYAYCSVHNFGIFKSRDVVTGVEGKEGTIPSEFALYQNYPNPFNPSTTIKFNIPPFSKGVSERSEDGGFTKLKVYDILGNEVATLVNEVKPAGTYEVEFNASNLSSGIYYYQIKAGSFIQTKKMILMK